MVRGAECHERDWLDYEIYIAGARTVASNRLQQNEVHAHLCGNIFTWEVYPTEDAAGHDGLMTNCRFEIIRAGLGL